MQTKESHISPTLTLDIKKRRFRIPQKTFSAIDNPEYFRILVNPNSKGLVIERCAENSAGSYQVSKIPKHRNCYELTSKSLMYEIVRCAGITGDDTIRLQGKHIVGQKALFFRLDNSNKLQTNYRSEGNEETNE